MNLASILLSRVSFKPNLVKYVNTLEKLFCNPTRNCSNFNITEKILTFDTRGKSMKFPLVWLRDNCQCEQCFHPASTSRILNWKHFNVNPKPAKISLNDNKINIAWADKHTSIFSVDWLNEHSFLKEDRDNYTNTIYKLPRVDWNETSFDSAFKRFNYNKILKCNDELKNWIEALSIYGVALIGGAGTDPDSCRNVANRIEFIKKTHYGEEFIVKNKDDTTNVAYLSSNLQLHTDLPYYEYKPGVNLLHCITQTAAEGGENLLADGLYVANQLKKYNKRYYDILTKVSIDWDDIGVEEGNRFHSIYRSPVICEDSNGEMIRVNYSTPQRGSHMNLDVEQVQEWYESYKSFTDLIYKHSAMYKVAEGEILCFDNKRLLHGRTEYKDSKENTRYVVGVYLDWDYINSRLRVLKKM